MKILLQAIRAATIETAGIVLVVCLLFGIPAWSFREVAASPSHEKAVWSWLSSWQHDRQPSTPLAQPGAEDRQAYAQRRLDLYSQAYRRAATDYARQMAREVCQGPNG